jgi:hypothetical protein
MNIHARKLEDIEPTDMIFAGIMVVLVFCLWVWIGHLETEAKTGG